MKKLWRNKHNKGGLYQRNLNEDELDENERDKIVDERNKSLKDVIFDTINDKNMKKIDMEDEIM